VRTACSEKLAQLDEADVAAARQPTVSTPPLDDRREIASAV
jgi:hypothetical protein